MRKKIRVPALAFAIMLAIFAIASSLSSTKFPMSEITDMSSGTAVNCTVSDNTITMTGEDPYVVFDIPDTYIKSIEIEVISFTRNYAFADEDEIPMRLYYQTAEGFSEQELVLSNFYSGDNYVVLYTNARVKALRLDLPETEPSSVTVERIIINPDTSVSNFVILGVVSALVILLSLLAGKDLNAKDFAVYEILIFVLCAVVFFFVINDRSNSTVAAGVICELAGAMLLTAMLKAGDGKHDRIFIVLLMISAFALYFFWALQTNFADAPDEDMRYQVVKFIYDYGYLPRGDEPEIRDARWGFSYAFYPILPYIIGAWFGRLASIFTQSEFALLMAARTVSILSTCFTVFWTFKIGKLVFKNRSISYALPVAIAFFPQLAFVSTYVNVDAFAVMTTAMIMYFWLLGAKEGWRVRDCVGLSISMGLCALSYYNCYGYILLSIPMFFISIFAFGRYGKKHGIKMTVLVIVLTLAICGWWFIRNMMLYDGDILARNAMNAAGEKYAMDSLKPSMIISPRASGMSLLGLLRDGYWLKHTVFSFLGGFSVMTLFLRIWMYKLYAGVVGICGIGFIVSMIRGIKQFRQKTFNQSRLQETGCDVKVTKAQSNEKKIRALWYVMIILGALIVGGLTLIYSYTGDYQPQGRYLIPGIVPVMICMCLGAEGIDRVFTWIICRIWGNKDKKSKNKKGIESIDGIECIENIKNIEGTPVLSEVGGYVFAGFSMIFMIITFIVIMCPYYI